MRQKLVAGSVQIAIVSIAILLALVLACAQDVTGPSLKAAFINNLAKFTDWPAEASGPKPFVMCVLGDAAVRDALGQTVKGRFVGGNIITVVRVTPTEPPPACRLLYVSGIPSDQIVRFIATLRDSPVLTISDVEGFIDMGGMVQFFFEHGQLRFSIGLESARAAHLQISAKILTLAIRK